jgi:hypothetical protein
LPHVEIFKLFADSYHWHNITEAESTVNKGEVGF